MPKIDKQKRYLYVAIDRATRLVYAKIEYNKTQKISAKFLEEAIKYYPFKIEKILTDNGGEFTNKMHYKYNNQNINSKTVKTKKT